MNWDNVFKAYPDVNEIFVVDGMPFLEAGHAQSHSRTTGKPVEAVQRKQAAPVKPEGDPAANTDPVKPEGDPASLKKGKGRKSK